MQDTLPVRVRLGAFELDLRAGELRAKDRTVRLQEQPFRILLMLVERGGEIVTRDEIQSKLWPNDTVVEFDHSINAAIKKLRQALGDSAENPQYIETVARRGYRLMVTAKPLAVEEQRVAPSASQAQPGKNLGRRATDKNIFRQKAQEQAQTVETNSRRRPLNGSLIGKKVSHYRVLDVLGGGGMGMVYKAEDLKLGRRVALKFLPEEMAWDPLALRRFEREARTASWLDHPNICAIYEVEEHEGQPFLVMPFLQGETLRDRLATIAAEKKKLSIDQLLDLAIQICAGLRAAHERRIVHRDIKPANIFLTASGQVKILDFGLAKLASVNQEITGEALLLETSGDGIQVSKLLAQDLTVTRLGVAIGTAGYMSPEQVRGERLDARSDLFSFGSVLYEMATGQRAFRGETTAAIHSAILSESPVAVRELNPEIPQAVEALIHKALEKDCASRYQTCAELQTELQCLQSGEDPKGHREDRGPRRWPSWLAGSLVLMLVAVAVAWFEWFRPVPSLKVEEHQLTANPLADAVTGGTISPDGKYVAYHDQTGLYLRSLDSGETRPVALPADLRGQLGSLRWLPGAGRLVADVKSDDGYDIWMISVLGDQEPRLLYRHGKDPAISPDGRSIVFLGYEPGKIQQDVWVGGTGGEVPRKLVDGGRSQSEFAPIWSPDGHWIAYGKRWKAGENAWRSAIEEVPASGGAGKVLVSDASFPQTSTLALGPVNAVVFTQSWSPDWRLIFSVTERPDSTISKPQFSLWKIQVASRTADVAGKPQPLTQWSDFGLANLTITTDGKTLSLIKSNTWSDVYVGELDDLHIKDARRLTLDDRGSEQAVWAHDSQAILFDSKRNGKLEIFRQALDENVAQVIISGPRDVYGVDSSPDGAWLLYWETGATHSDSSQSATSPRVDARAYSTLMRKAVAGGSLEGVLDNPRAAAGVGAFYCASSPGAVVPCVLGLQEGREVVFYSLDPVRGQGGQLGKIEVSDPVMYVNWAVSSDGSRVALLDEDRYPGCIKILNVSQGTWSQVSLEPGAGRLQSIAWSADGAGFFVTRQRGSSVLAYVSMSGKLQRLSGAERLTQFASTPLPSPDGKHLGFEAETRDSNLWMIKNF